jgi:hypothetical protein
MTKFINNAAPVSFNYDAHVEELTVRFGRLIKQLKSNNRKGTPRYNFEVEFSYALNEIKNCPPYLQGKMFDQATNVVNELINQINQLKLNPEAEALLDEDLIEM